MVKLHLETQRQAGPNVEGHSEFVGVNDAAVEMSILKLLDHVNSKYVESSKESFAFTSDYREGICGTCGLNVSGRPHSPDQNTPTCQQRLYQFNNGDTLRVEPMRSAAYPVIGDVIVDRSTLNRVLEQGGYVLINTGTAPGTDTLHLNREAAEFTLDHAVCIGYGACITAYLGGAVHLFIGAKLVHLSLVPLGREERGKRTHKMVDEVKGAFGPCSLYGEHAGVCPAGIPLTAVTAATKERARLFFHGRGD